MNWVGLMLASWTSCGANVEVRNSVVASMAFTPAFVIGRKRMYSVSLVGSSI